MSADEHGHVLVEDGRSLVVEDDGERIGAGPWARWLASAVVPDESSARAQRGRTLARTGAVDSVSISAGAIVGRVTGSTGNLYDVSIQATPVPARVWQDTVRSARSRPPLAPAVEGRVQSVHLAHLMSTAGASGGRLRAARTVSCQTRAGTGAARIDTS